ncbi:E3 ubiquitin-protein ligase TRIM69-like [Ambystoma mexicanum]|uniref:E3 ubiquitin-protein ligase TRIM69-like n=1 Tax=Ambystoma mexicanum TaxID=8296 RepID=UPI0037E7DEFF
MERARDQGRNQPFPRGPLRKQSVRRRAIILGVMTAINIFMNIVLYRVVERELFLIPRLESCSNCLEGGSSQNSLAGSLLKPTWCVHPVSKSDQRHGQKKPIQKLCSCANHEPGTEDFSSWSDMLPPMSETQCLRTVLLTLDPKTAHRNLVLSQDRRQVRWRATEQPLLDNAKRFSMTTCVLGSEGFTSGIHYWELQLLPQDTWASGIAHESVPTNKHIPSPETGIWAVTGHNDSYMALNPPFSYLYAHQHTKKLGWYLDFEGGRLSLYNADTLEHLYTFSNASFTEGLYPYFCTKSETGMLLV